MPGPARKWVKWLLAGIAALLCVVLLAATWLVTTEAGLRRAVTFVESVGSVKIRVEGASGRLIGPLVVDAVEIEHPRASIRIAGLEADYEPLEILAGRISAEGVKIREATVALHPATGPPRPPSFMPGWLTVAVDDAAVANLLIVSPNGTRDAVSRHPGLGANQPLAPRVQGRARALGRLGRRRRGRDAVRARAARARRHRRLVADRWRSRGGHRPRDRRPRTPSRRRPGRSAGPRPRPGGGPRPHLAAHIPGQGRHRIARPRAVDREAAGGPARGIARVRRRSPGAMPRAARCTGRACRQTASTSMRARAMRARSLLSSPSRS